MIRSRFGVAIVFVCLAATVLAQEITGPHARFNVRIPMRDGVTLSADIYFPATSGRFPTILMRTPYDKSRGYDLGARWTKSGYVVVAQDCRGRYDSDGVFHPLFDEGRDGQDTIRWIASQPWSNGEVGTFGGSYGGWVQWLAAPDAPEPLAAMVPIAAPPDPFLNVPFTNGALTFGLADWALLMDGRINHTFNRDLVDYGSIARQVYHSDEVAWKLPVVDFDKSCGRNVAWWRDWVTHNRFDDFWAPMSYQDKYDRISAPALNITGWYDVQLIGAILNYTGMREHGKTAAARQTALLIGPWGHLINQALAVRDFGKQSTIDLDAVLERWWGHWLKGQNTGVGMDSPIRLFVMGTNHWQDEQEWPPARVQYTSYYLHGSGRANSSEGDGLLSREKPLTEPSDHYAYDPVHPVLNRPAYTAAGIGSESLVFPGDLSAIHARSDVLVYQTSPLEEDVEIIGPVTLKLYAATSGPDTDWVARLSDAAPDGSAWALCGTILRARYRESFSHPTLLTPGKTYAYELQFWPTANHFFKGHRIRLDITSSAFPTFDRNLNTGEDNETSTKTRVAQQTVLHDAAHPSAVVLPIVPAGQAR